MYYYCSYFDSFFMFLMLKKYFLKLKKDGPLRNAKQKFDFQSFILIDLLLINVLK